MSNVLTWDEFIGRLPATISIHQPTQTNQESTKPMTIEGILNPNVLAFMKLTPMPPEVKGHILKATGLYPPDEAVVDYVTLSKWVLDNYKQKPNPIAVAKPVAPTIPSTIRARLPCRIDAQEYGSCRYTRSYVCRSVEVDINDIIQTAEDSSTINEFERNVRQLVVDIGNDMSFDDMEFEEENHDDHESDDNNTEVETFSDTFEEAMELLRSSNPELANKFNDPEE